MVINNLVSIREKHVFDLKKFYNWLNENLPNYGSVKDLKQFVGGQSNPTFIIEFEEKKSLILRKKPPGKLLPSAHAIEREYKVQKALEDTNIPCPKMIKICEDTNVIGTPFYLMELVEGKVFDSILDIKDINNRNLYYFELVKMLASLHNIEYSKIGLTEFGKKGSYINRQIFRWEKQWHLSKQRELPEMQKIIDWLNDNLPDYDDTTIVHGDYRIGNILFNSASIRINAVLDWELSTLGHPFADLGYFLYAHYIPTGERHGLMGYNLEELNIPSVNELVSQYCKVRKVKVFDPTYYVVLSLFRNIAILEGVYARYINGNESSPNAKEIGKDVEPFAKATYNIIKKL